MPIDKSNWPTRAQVVEAARFCVGTKFRDQGRTPGRGLDCAGLIDYVGTSTGAALDHCTVNYPRWPNEYEVRMELHKHLDLVPGGFKDAIPGDILLLVDHDHAVHMAILAEENSCLTMIHATSLWPRRVEEIDLDDEWRKAIRGVFRYRRLAD